MTIGSTTADIHMINIAITAADGSGRMWQNDTQMIPLSMNGNPEGFVAAIKAGLPLVNNLRVMFNEYSFNSDGSMNPQFERFLAAAAAQGFEVTISYGSGDTQNIGIGDAAHPSLTNTQAYAALEQNFGKIEGAWDKMMDWMADHPTIRAAVYGWDLMNEPAAYRHTIAANGADAAYDQADFVTLYAQHCAALADAIAARAEGKVLVGGWGYNGDFATLANTAMGAGSVQDYLRGAVGDALVWSAHLYPGWMGTSTVADPQALIAKLNAIFGALQGDDVLLTEVNIKGAVDDPAQAPDYVDFFASSLEWFAQNGIGLGWFPGLQTGESHLLYVEKNGSLTLRHQHSFAHAMNGYSMGESDTTALGKAHAGNEVMTTTLFDAALRNEDYEIAQGEGKWDALRKVGTAFGFGGNDTLTGSELAHDFMYGGTGRDVLRTTGGDDFLFGQADDDKLIGGTGIDHLFGGTGRDTLDGGANANVLAGGQGDDLYLVQTTRDTVREFAGGGVDTVLTTQRTMSLATMANVENLSFQGSPTARDSDFRGTGNGLANWLSGGTGDDTLSAGAGRDTLTGWAGNDMLSGGADADRFVFCGNGGDDRITDFGAGDVLVLRNHAGVATVADAFDHARQVGQDVLFDFGVDTVLLQGVRLADLVGDILVS